MTELFWLLCLTLVLLVLLVLWVLGKPIPRYRGAPPAEEPTPRQWVLGLLGLLVGIAAGLALGVWVYLFEPDLNNAGFAVATHDNVLLSAMCLGAGIALPLTVLLVRMLSSPETFQYFRAWDARIWRGVDTVKATPFAMLLLLFLGYLYLPGWITGDRDGLRHQTPLPFTTRSHSWSDLHQLRSVKQRRLIFGWWGDRPGAVWRFQDGSHYRAFVNADTDLQRLALATRWSSLRSGVRVEQRQRDD